MNENDLFNEIINLSTEQINLRTKNIDNISTTEILQLVNNEDKIVPYAVEKVIPDIAEAVEIIADSFEKGGRLFYVGAGTSGRLGIIDSAECPPTFGTEPEMVQAIIAGGKEAVFKAQEGAEDSFENGRKIIGQYNITEKDVLCGIAASGRTPFVKGALYQAKSRRIKTIIISISSKQQVIEMGIVADIYICPEVGPEVIAGSTRMKSGTAQKLILNMLSTASMIKLGKVYNNIMVDLQLTNNKLRERAKNIIMTIASVDYKKATELLSMSKGSIKIALVMALTNSDYIKAKELLDKADGFVKKAIEFHKKEI